MLQPPLNTLFWREMYSNQRRNTPSREYNNKLRAKICLFFYSNLVAPYRRKRCVDFEVISKTLKTEILQRKAAARAGIKY